MKVVSVSLNRFRRACMDTIRGHTGFLLNMRLIKKCFGLLTTVIWCDFHDTLSSKVFCLLSSCVTLPPRNQRNVSIIDSIGSIGWLGPLLKMNKKAHLPEHRLPGPGSWKHHNWFCSLSGPVLWSKFLDAPSAWAARWRCTLTADRPWLAMRNR